MLETVPAKFHITGGFQLMILLYEQRNEMINLINWSRDKFKHKVNSN